MTSRKNRYFDREDQFRSIILSNDIDNESVEEVIQFILDANEYDDEQDSVSKDFERKPIKLVVNSFGGVIYDGFALISVIENSITPIHTYCYGYAMSMGLPIFASGHKRFASKYATFMYHEGHYELEGKVAFHKQELIESERIDKICDKYFLSKTKFTDKILKPHRDRQAEWYFDVKTAQKYGLVDEILE